MTDPIVREVLEFWFGAPGSAEHGTRREIWFRGRTPEFDEEIRARFLDVHERAAAGNLDYLMETAEGCLALCIMLDQFPRNMFRQAPRAFATDAKALSIAKHAVAQGFDDEVSEVERTFFYLPYEHSENLADQEEVVRLMAKTGSERGMEAAQEHYDIVARFGRFPHRNAILGRESTPEEEAYLAGNPKSFGQGDDAFEEGDKKAG